MGRKIILTDEQRKERKKESQAKYRDNNRDLVRQRVDNYKKNHKDKYDESRRIGQKKYATNNPDKIKAQNKANYELEIPYDKLCDKCKDDIATEKHHQDYSKPLEVMFLCKECHTKEHLKKKENKIEE